MPLGQSQDIPQTNPLDTTIALQHLIFEGTLDRFPGLKVLAAHGG
jgi:aminocarboxymuconate-semialdehyde decarboxylase